MLQKINLKINNKQNCVTKSLNQKTIMDDQYLKYKNPHDRDIQISFDPDSHTYLVNGKLVECSVTKFISAFFSEFESEKILTKENIKKWRSSPQLFDYKILLTRGLTEILASDHSIDAIDSIIILTFQLGWNLMGRVAAMRGQSMHRTLEEILNMEPEKLMTIQNFSKIESELLEQHHSDNDENVNLKLAPFSKEIEFWPKDVVQALGKKSSEKNNQDANSEIVLSDKLSVVLEKCFPTIPKSLRDLITGSLRSENPEKSIKMVMHALCKKFQIPDDLFSIYSPQCTIGSSEMKSILDWMAINFENLEPFRTEFAIFSDVHSIAGQVDAVFKRKTSGHHQHSCCLEDGGEDRFISADPSPTEYVLVDWKRTNKLFSMEKSVTTFFQPKFAKHPFNHLIESVESKYTLQILTYAYLLTKFYGMKIVECRIISIHPDLPSFHEIVLPYPNPLCSELTIEEALNQFFEKN